MSEIEYGFNSPLWMAKMIVLGADPHLLAHAVVEVMDYIWNDEHPEADEIFDRLVQVSMTGQYLDPEITQEQYEETMKIADEFLQKAEDEAVEKFRKEMDEWGSDGDAE